MSNVERSPYLAPEEAVVLDVLIDGKLMRERVPVPDRRIVSRFEKYAFPIGLDKGGDPFPIPSRRDDDDDATPG